MARSTPIIFNHSNDAQAHTQINVVDIASVNIQTYRNPVALSGMNITLSGTRHVHSAATINGATYY